MSPKEVLEFATKSGVKQVDLRFSDIPSPQRHISCPITELSEESFYEGFGVDGSRVQAWAPVEESDMLLIPDPDTVFLDPFYELPTLVMTCDVFDPITHQNHGRDPRWIAKKAELYLKNTGFGDAAYFSAEAEFFVFDGVRFDQSPHSAFHFVDLQTNHLASLRTTMVETMLQCGLRAVGSRPEVTGSQLGIEQRCATLLKAADNMMMYKYIVRNVACRGGKTVTFMPKPRFGDRGNGMHTRQSIWKEGEPIFAGKESIGLSQTGLHYIGGLLKHAPALSALVAPTTNSYKRLASQDPPLKIGYSREDRSAVCRVLVDPDGLRIEFRPPDPSANPYLAFSAMLMAGLDGVLRKIDPGEPLEWNRDDAARQQMPESLDEALECVDDDHDFLIKSDVFNEDTLETFIEYKRRHESEALRARPHPHEFELYYDV